MRRQQSLSWRLLYKDTYTHLHTHRHTHTHIHTHTIPAKFPVFDRLVMLRGGARNFRLGGPKHSEGLGSHRTANHHDEVAESVRLPQVPHVDTGGPDSRTPRRPAADPADASYFATLKVTQEVNY